MDENPYRLLAQRLDSLPNGFPPAPDGAELRLLEKLFTPEEAALAAYLRLTRETPEQIAGRISAGRLSAQGLPSDPGVVREMLKSMARRGLISAGRVEGGLGYGLIPFVVGIYENQVDRMDAELARLFEDYYQSAFGAVLAASPPVHRVVPVGESVRVDIEIQPYESVSAILDGAQAWGVLDCVCRKQKALLGEPCEHPIDVCMALSRRAGAFDDAPAIRALTRDEASTVLRRAADAGLVHSVSNNQRGVWYVCNCCTCSCGVLRGIAELGIANAVARSAFVNQVDEDRCIGCEDCLEACQFDALSLDGTIQVSELRCLGCGVCVPTCPEGALGLVRRPESQVKPIPADEAEWLHARAASRGVDIRRVL